MRYNRHLKANNFAQWIAEVSFWKSFFSVGLPGIIITFLAIKIPKTPALWIGVGILVLSVLLFAVWQAVRWAYAAGKRDAGTPRIVEIGKLLFLPLPVEGHGWELVHRFTKT